MTYGLEQWDPDSPDEFDSWYSDETGLQIAHRLKGLRAATLLDIGCATGRMTAQLVAPGRRILAVTLNAAMIERAKARDLLGVRWVCGDVLDFQHMEFDIIVCASVLHEVVSPQSIMRKCHELLAPDGRVFVTVPSAKSLHFNGQPLFGDRAERFGVRRLWTPVHWQTELESGTGLRVMVRQEMMLKPYENARMACLAPEVLGFLAGYRGPGGAIVIFELEAAV